MKQALGADLTTLLDQQTRKRVWEKPRRLRRIEWAEATLKTLTGRERHVIGNIMADYGPDKQIRRIKGYILLDDAGRGRVQGKKGRKRPKKTQGTRRVSQVGGPRANTR